MAKQLINRGSTPNDKSGDTLRVGAEKINNNFSEIYSVLGDGDNLLSLNDVAYSGSYNDLTNKPTSFSGSYADLTDKPTTILGYGITDAFSGSYTNLTNKPTLFSGSYTNLTNKPTTISGYGITDAFSGSYTDLTNKPTIPAVLTDLGITDGTIGQVLTTDGAGTYTFEDTAASVGLSSRITTAGTTASLADAATGDLDITGFKGYSLLAIQTDKAAWVRIYANGETRTADASRLETTDPTPDAGVIAEVITTGAQTVLVSPGTIGYNFESIPTTTIPCAVKNKSGSVGTVTVTLTVLQLEA
jgi:hypothetical protein